jgi:transposase InsO family protein
MAEEALLTPRKRRFKPRTTDSNHSYPKFVNLAKALPPRDIDQLWVCDITYIELATERVTYLALVMDAFSRRVLGWKLDTRMDASLVTDTLAMAGQARGFSKSNPGYVIVHSDQGSQYASWEHRKALAAYGLIGVFAQWGRGTKLRAWRILPV